MNKSSHRNLVCAAEGSTSVYQGPCWKGALVAPVTRSVTSSRH